jgi:hypothetical protein
MAVSERNEESSKSGPDLTDPSRSVFLSYASSDAATAQAICRFLETHGGTCWMAPRDVRPGVLHADAILRGINEAAAFVVVLSAAAVASSHVTREVERAGSKQKPLIAFRMDAAPLSPALEYFLSDSQWIDVAALGMPAALEKLLEAVQEDAEDVVDAGAHVVPVRPLSSTGWTGRHIALAVAGVLIIGILVAMIARLLLPAEPRPSGAVGSPITAPVAAIPDLSIAVLPFHDRTLTGFPLLTP